MVTAAKPIFIGGTGGSGTRAFTLVIEAGGAYMGPERNVPQEPQRLLPFTRTFAPRLIEHTRSLKYDVDELPADQRTEALSALAEIAEYVQQNCASELGRWGWKHPRNVFLVPLLHRLFPDCYFLHVVRDGRDIGLASNQGQLRTFGAVLLDPPPGDDVWNDSLRLWDRVNIDVAEICENALGPRYIRSRLEDLCNQPEVEIRRLFGLMGLSDREDAVAAAMACVRTPASLGRWQALPRDQLRLANQVAGRGLHRFGYL